MLGSKKRDYKTEHNKIKKDLVRHKELMDKYVAEGLQRNEASLKARQVIQFWGDIK